MSKKTPITLLIILIAVGSATPLSQESANDMENKDSEPTPGVEKATFGAGCFWCVEAIFQRLEGVEQVITGYAGGNVKNPTYKEVCTGNTGHAEVIQVHYDPSRIRFKDLLEVFWKSHDPTQKNGQGADIGPQYRSAIFYHNEEQRVEAERYKEELDASGAWQHPIVTEISPCKNFSPAEQVHQDYYDKNPEAAYCRAVIVPKLERLKEVFADKWRPER